MRVLITQPAQEAAVSAKALAARGHEPIAIPLVTVERESSPNINLASAQGFLATSPEGVRALAEHVGVRTFPIFVESELSAAEARRLGFKEVLAAKDDAQDLARLIERTLKPANGALVYACSTAAPVNLSAMLGNMGFAVRPLPLYSIKRVAEIPAALREKLNSREIDAALFLSPDEARAFVTLLQREETAPVTAGLKTVAATPAIAAPLRALNGASVTVAAASDPTSIWATLDGELIDKVEAERRENELMAKEEETRRRLEEERLQKEKADRERAAREREEAERLERARREAERERIAKEEAERAELTRLAREEERRVRAEEEQRRKQEAERERVEKAAREKAEREGMAAERAAAEAADRERRRKEQEERERARAEQEVKARVERERLAAEKAAREQAERERIAAERAERERVKAKEAARAKAERDRLEAERAAAEAAERERLRKEKEEGERLRAEQEAVARAERERLAAEKAAREQAERERLRIEKEERERQRAAEEARQRAERERIAAERAEQDRLRREREEQDRIAQAERERARLEQEARERAERERIAAEQASHEKALREQEAREKAARDEAERQRLAAERAAWEEAERVKRAAEKAERDRREAERLERERIAQEARDKERAEKERLAREEAERARAETARLAAVREQERLEREKEAKAKAERERAEQARIAAAREQERLERERLAREEAERARAEAAHLAAVREQERLEREKEAKARAERERVAREARAEEERKERERRGEEEQRARAEREEAARLEKERLALEKAERERLKAEAAAQEAERKRIAREEAAAQRAREEQIRREEAAKARAEEEQRATELAARRAREQEEKAQAKAERKRRAEEEKAQARAEKARLKAERAPTRSWFAVLFGGDFSRTENQQPHVQQPDPRWTMEIGDDPPAADPASRDSRPVPPPPDIPAAAVASAAPFWNDKPMNEPARQTNEPAAPAKAAADNAAVPQALQELEELVARESGDTANIRAESLADAKPAGRSGGGRSAQLLAEDAADERMRDRLANWGRGDAAEPSPPPEPDMKSEPARETVAAAPRARRGSGRTIILFFALATVATAALMSSHRWLPLLTQGSPAPVATSTAPASPAPATTPAAPAPAAPPVSPVAAPAAREPAPASESASNQTIAALMARIATLEAALGNTAKLDELNRRVDLLAGRSADANSVLALADRVTALEQGARSAADARAAAVALTIAATQWRDAVVTGRPFLKEWDTVKALTGQTQADAPFAKYANSGLPTLADLQRRFDGAAAAAVRASYLPNDTAPWLRRTLDRVFSVITVRRTDIDTGDGLEAILVRAERAVDGGNVAASIAEMQKLSGAALAAAQPWIDIASAKVAAEEAAQESVIAGATALAVPNAASAPPAAKAE